MLNIDDIIYYGRYYSCENEKKETMWWYNCVTNKVYSTQELVDNFSFNNQDNIMQSNNYIPLFKTDVIELEKVFLNQFYPRLVKIVYNNSLNCDYDISFKRVIERNNLQREWFEYEKSQLRKDAIEWCCKNNLPYSK